MKQSPRYRDRSRGLQLWWEREHTFHRDCGHAGERQRATDRKTWRCPQGERGGRTELGQGARIRAESDA